MTIKVILLFIGKRLFSDFNFTQITFGNIFIYGCHYKRSSLAIDYKLVSMETKTNETNSKMRPNFKIT